MRIPLAPVFAAFLVTGSLAFSAPAAPVDPAIIALPEFQVFANRDLPRPESWLYTRVGNVEFLSNDSERSTKRFVREFQEFQNVLEVISPQFVIRAELPITVIICAKGNQFESFAGEKAVRIRRGMAAALLRDQEIASILVDLERKRVNNWFSDLFGEADGEDIYHQQEFYREYIHLALSRQQPRPPAWLAEGLAQIFSSVDYSNDWIEFGKKGNFLTPRYVSMPVPYSSYGRRSAFRDASMWADDGMYYSRGSLGGYGRDYSYGGFDGYAHNFGFRGGFAGEDFWDSPSYERRRIPAYIMSMKKFFAVDYDSKEFKGAASAELNNEATWPRQAATFVHMCLYGENGRYRPGFLKLAERATHEPVTEQLFKECMGLTFRAAALELRGYTEMGRHDYITYHAKKDRGFMRIQEAELRPATDAEIGRIKGEAFRLSGQDDSARAEFVKSYLRGERDPQLLASLGLMARQRGDSKRAQTYLEAVGKVTDVQRPRAYLELARLRREALPAASNKALSTDQTRDLLAPLFVARGLSPRIADVYIEIATVWEHSVVKPTRSHLAVLDEGVRIFPFNTDVIYRSASLLAKHGFKADAAARVEHGLKVSRDAETRARFEQLKQQLGGAGGGSGGSAAAP